MKNSLIKKWTCPCPSTTYFVSNPALVEYYLDCWSNPFAEWPSSRAIENHPHPGRAVAAASPKPLSGTNFVANFVVNFVEIIRPKTLLVCWHFHGDRRRQETGKTIQGRRIPVSGRLGARV
jgi:hypothetical protein